MFHNQTTETLKYFEFFGDPCGKRKEATLHKKKIDNPHELSKIAFYCLYLHLPYNKLLKY